MLTIDTLWQAFPTRGHVAISDTFWFVITGGQGWLLLWRPGMLLTSACYNAHSNPRRKSRMLTVPRRNPTEPMMERPASVTEAETAGLGPPVSGLLLPSSGSSRAHVGWRRNVRNGLLPLGRNTVASLGLPD